VPFLNGRPLRLVSMLVCVYRKQRARCGPESRFGLVFKSGEYQTLPVASILSGWLSAAVIGIVLGSLSRHSRGDRRGRRYYNSKSVRQDNALLVGRKALVNVSSSSWEDEATGRRAVP
jgi:hypothetical protein